MFIRYIHTISTPHIHVIDTRTLDLVMEDRRAKQYITDIKFHKGSLSFSRDHFLISFLHSYLFRHSYQTFPTINESIHTNVCHNRGS